MTITIISVGNRPKATSTQLIDEFITRLPKHVHIEWRYIKHAAAATPDTSKHQESEAILKALPKTPGQIILLDERGKQLSSPQLAHLLFGGHARNTTLIVGGAYGVTSQLRSKADVVWSLGKLVYPHQLIRVILAEQLYRAHSIHIGHPYHHE